MTTQTLFTTATQAGAFFAKDEVLSANADAAIAGMLGKIKDYKAFVTFRDEFKSGASAEGYADTDKLWSRRALLPAKARGWEPPKAPAPEAKRKSESRQKHAERVEAIIGEHKTIEGVQKAMAAVPPTEPAQIKAFADAMVKIDKAAREVAKGTASAELKAARESLANAVKALDAKQVAELARVATLMGTGAAFTLKQSKAKAK